MIRPEGEPLTRLGAPHPVRLIRPDLILVAAMLVVAASYALGYKLDWSSDQGFGFVEEEEEETAGAQVPAPASLQTVSIVSPKIQPETAMGQAPTLSLAPNPEEVNWEKMTGELTKQVSHHPGRVAVFLKDLKTQREWSYHPDDLFPAASLIKVPVLISAFYKIHAGELGLSDQLTLRRRTRVGGSGSLKWRPDGTKLTVEELLIRMINESDNTATAMLLDALGIGWVQQQFPRMGLLYTGIYPEGMSIKGGRVAHENYTTAREMSMLMESIYSGKAVDKDSSILMLEILKRRKATASRLAKGLPMGWEIAHKTGLLRLACHDSAIFLTPHGDYLMTVLTGQNRSYHSAKDFITKLGKITFRYYTGSDRLVRNARRRRDLARR